MNERTYILLHNIILLVGAILCWIGIIMLYKIHFLIASYWLIGLSFILIFNMGHESPPATDEDEDSI
jgi:hypothetical protein